MENLTSYVDELRDRAYEYTSHKDFIGNYIDSLFNDSCSDLYYDDIDEDLIPSIRCALEDMNPFEILDICDIDTHRGFSRNNNEIISWPLFEIEISLEDDKGFISMIKDMSDDDINNALNDCEACVINNTVFIDISYDRIAVTLKDSFIDTLIK